MNRQFMAWIIQLMDGWESQSKQKFLRKVKSKPDTVTRTFADSLVGWSTKYYIETGNSVPRYNDVRAAEDAPVLLEACRDHFAAELAELK